jgi:hypothetical protein
MLTLAVWSIGAILLALVGTYAYWFVKSTRAFARSTSSSVSSTESGRDFDTLTPEEKIRRSSAILVTKHQKDGGRLKAIVAEILKQPPNEGLQYSVGDEFVSLSHYGDETTYGDGDVVFFSGSPSSMRESMTYRSDRISMFGDMPLQTLRDLVSGKSPAAARPVSPLPSTAPAAAPAIPESEHPVTLEEATNSDGVTRVFEIRRAAVLKIPEWLPETSEPPLLLAEAIRLGAEAARAQSPDHSTFVARSVRLQLVGCCESFRNRWYYDMAFVPTTGGSVDMSHSVDVVILMDGTVVNGRIKR